MHKTKARISVRSLIARQCRLLARGMLPHLLLDKLTAEATMSSNATARKVLSALTRSRASLEEVTASFAVPQGRCRCYDVGSNKPVFLVEVLLI